MKKRTLESALGAALLLAALAFANLIASLVNARLDLSRGSIYSLTPASRKIVSQLDDPVLVKAYFSETLPPEYAANRRYLESFLKEYALYSKGRFKYEFARLSGDKADEVKREAQSEGIAPVRFNVYSREKIEVQEGFMGLTIKYEDKKEVLPLLTDVSTLEYDVTSRIRRMTTKKKPVVAFATGFGAAAPTELPEAVAAGIGENYSITTVDLSRSTQPVGSEVSALLLLGPTEKLDDKARYKLDQYLLSGRTLAVAVDTTRVDLRSFLSSPIETGVPDWLKAYGVTVAPGTVLDAQNQKISIVTHGGVFQMSYIVDYPPMVLATDLNRDLPLTRELQGLVLPFSSPLEFAKGISASALATSSPASWLKKGAGRGYASMNPTQSFSPEPGDTKGPFILAAALQGPFRSAFSEPPKGAPETGYRAQSAKDARLVVFGTSRFIRSEMPTLQANQAFFLNLVDWMAQEQDLISIRSKEVVFKPLRSIPDAEKTLVRYADIFLPPGLVVLFGGWRWDRRRRWKASRTRAYGLETA